MNTTPITNSDVVIATIAQEKEKASRIAFAEFSIFINQLSIPAFTAICEYLKAKPKEPTKELPFWRATIDSPKNLTITIHSVRKSIEDDNN